MKSNLRLSAVGQDARPDLFSSSSTTGLVHKTEASHFYIGDEEEPADEAADAKETRRQEVTAHWMEVERIQAMFGYPPRRGRKWMRRNMKIEHIEVELEATGREDDTENAAPEAETFEDVNAVDKKKITRRKKKKIKKKEKPLYFIDGLD